MTDEILIEEGIVISSSKGFAEINISRSESCEECSAKIICKPRGKDSQFLKVIDPFGTLPGDKVKISIDGKVLLNSSFKLYGIPLILLLGSIYFSIMFFSGSKFAELYSFLSGMLVVAIYYSAIFFSNISNQKLILPHIISYSRNNS